MNIMQKHRDVSPFKMKAAELAKSSLLHYLFFFPLEKGPLKKMDASQNHLESQTIYYKAPDRKSLNKYIKPFLAGI